MIPVFWYMTPCRYASGSQSRPSRIQIRLLEPADEGTVTLWNNGHYSPNNTASHWQKTGIFRLVVQQLKILPALYESHNFITVFKKLSTGIYPEPHTSTDITSFFGILSIV
jgi:hypothetical protein